jgi:hypothetical protein
MERNCSKHVAPGLTWVELQVFLNLIMLMHVSTNDDGTLALPMNEQNVSSFV